MRQKRGATRHRVTDLRSSFYEAVVGHFEVLCFDGSVRSTKSHEASRNTKLLRAVSCDFVDRAFHFNPFKYQELRSGIRRSLTRRFPYAVYFFVEDKVIVVWQSFTQPETRKKVVS